jgi:hypothetical protein
MLYRIYRFRLFKARSKEPGASLAKVINGGTILSRKTNPSLSLERRLSNFTWQCLKGAVSIEDELPC